MSNVGVYDLNIEQGSTFAKIFTWKVDDSPVNLTGYTAKLEIRGDPDDTSPILTLTNGSGITLGGSAGTIAVLITAAQASGIPNDVYYWSLELTTGTNVRALLTGKVYVGREVTR